MTREMIWPALQSIAQISIEHILNSLPEGLLIAIFAWGMLRLLPRQNSGTRFAVWFVALVSIAGLPFIRGVAGERSFAPGVAHAVVLPGTLGFLLFLLWILAASAATLRLAVGLWHLRRLRRSCIIVDPARLDPAIQKTLGECGSLRPVILAVSDKVSVPAAIGFFKPLIVLPAWALSELPADELNVILLHEFAHLRRWDDWTNLLQKIVRAVFLFHPAVWWIDHRLTLEREMACDDAVLAATANPRSYAQCLISLLERNLAQRGWAMAQAAVHRAREVSLRLARILDAGRPNGRHVWKPAVGLLSAFCVVCLVAMARAPQLVAFERSQSPFQSQTASSDVATSLTSKHFPLSDAIVIPAALHGSAASSPKRLHAHRGGHQLMKQVVPQVARNQSPELSQLLQQQRSWARAIAVLAGANQPVSTATETTLLFIQTTHHVGRNSWISSVYVWRIEWVQPSLRDPGQRDSDGTVPTQQKPARIRTAGGPMAKTT